MNKKAIDICLFKYVSNLFVQYTLVNQKLIFQAHSKQPHMSRLLGK